MSFSNGVILGTALLLSIPGTGKKDCCACKVGECEEHNNTQRTKKDEFMLKKRKKRKEQHQVIEADD